MQLWGGRGPAGSAARPAPALTQQSPQHVHAQTCMLTHTDTHTHRGAHTCANAPTGSTRRSSYARGQLTPPQIHSQARILRPTCGHTEICMLPGRGRGGGMQGEEEAQPCSQVAPSVSLPPSALTPRPTASDLSPPGISTTIYNRHKAPGGPHDHGWARDKFQAQESPNKWGQAAPARAYKTQHPLLYPTSYLRPVLPFPPGPHRTISGSGLQSILGEYVGCSLPLASQAEEGGSSQEPREPESGAGPSRKPGQGQASLREHISPPGSRTYVNLQAGSLLAGDDRTVVPPCPQASSARWASPEREKAGTSQSHVATGDF